MRTTHHAITGLTFLVLLTACSGQPPELSQSDQDAIKAHIEKYRQAVLAADWATWGNTLAADVIVMPPNASPVAGRDAAIAWVKTFPPITGFTVDVQEVTGRGDLAFARGTYELQMKLPDSSAVTDRGVFLEVHQRRTDGTLAIHALDASLSRGASSGPAGDEEVTLDDWRSPRDAA